MSKVILYDHEGEEVKKEHSILSFPDFPLLVIFVICACVAICSGVKELTKKPTTSGGVNTAYFTATTGVDGVFTISRAVLDEQHTVPSKREVDALNVAVKAWRLAGLHFKTPELIEGNNCEDDGSQTIACADLINNRITVVVANAKSVNLPTVMMHEVGHLLGVPHIQGDPLMDPVYNVILDKPTPFAIAIAKAHQANLETVLR